MKLIGSVSRVRKASLKVLLVLVTSGFVAALVAEEQVTHDPWWTHAKDLLLLMIALWAAYRQVITESIVSFYDGSDPEGTPVELANTYTFYVLFKRPHDVLVEILGCSTEHCHAERVATAAAFDSSTFFSDDGSAQLTCDATLDGSDKLRLVARLPSASEGAYRISGFIDLQVRVVFDTRPKMRRQTLLRYSLDCVVENTDGENE
jgi:hypothetical protein